MTETHEVSLTFEEIPMDAIHPSPYQARRSFNPTELEELAVSIRHYGLLHRIRVRPYPNQPGQYQLVYGERRWRAARLVPFTTISAEIGLYSDEELQEIGLIENLQRKDLSPLDEATMFHHLLIQKDKPYTIRSLAERLGKDKNYVGDRVALLRLPEDLQQLLQANPKVSLRSLREIAKLLSPETREPLLRQLQAGLLSTEEVRELVLQQLQQPTKSAQSIKPAQEEDTILPFMQALNKSTRRTQSAIDHLHQLATLYAQAPSPQKKQALHDSLHHLQQELSQIEQNLS